MKYTKEQKRSIYDSTDGRCHLCNKKLAMKNYGVIGARGAWEADHSNPRARGGTDRLTNLKPACISCNRSKGAATTRSVRRKNGFTRAPESKATRLKRSGRIRLLGKGILVLASIGILVFSQGRVNQLRL